MRIKWQILFTVQKQLNWEMKKVEQNYLLKYCRETEQEVPCSVIFISVRHEFQEFDPFVSL
jgi:hypothetical protein